NVVGFVSHHEPWVGRLCATGACRGRESGAGHHPENEAQQNPRPPPLPQLRARTHPHCCHHSILSTRTCFVRATARAPAAAAKTRPRESPSSTQVRSTRANARATPRGPASRARGHSVLNTSAGLVR